MSLSNIPQLISNLLENLPQTIFTNATTNTPIHISPLPVLPVGVLMPRLVQVIPIGSVLVHFHDAPMPVLATLSPGLVKLVSSHARAGAGTMVALQIQFDARVDVNRIAKVCWQNQARDLVFLPFLRFKLGVCLVWRVLANQTW